MRCQSAMGGHHGGGATNVVGEVGEEGHVVCNLLGIIDILEGGPTIVLIELHRVDQ